MHPIKDATSFGHGLDLEANISIHAPYKGCNKTVAFIPWDAWKFQSMHPIKDATYSMPSSFALR